MSVSQIRGQSFLWHPWVACDTPVCYISLEWGPPYSQAILNRTFFISTQPGCLLPREVSLYYGRWLYVWLIRNTALKRTCNSGDMVYLFMESYGPCLKKPMGNLCDLDVWPWKSQPWVVFPTTLSFEQKHIHLTVFAVSHGESSTGSL